MNIEQYKIFKDAKCESVEILQLQNNDKTIRIYRVTYTNSLNMSMSEYHLNAYEEFDNQEDYCFYHEIFSTLSKAITDMHRFLMCEYSTSIYATDDDDESSYDSYR